MQILQPYLGSAISGTVAHLTDEFAILHFDVELASGDTETVPGLLHSRGADLAGLVVSTLHLLNASKPEPAGAPCIRTHVSGGLHDGQICSCQELEVVLETVSTHDRGLRLSG